MLVPGAEPGAGLFRQCGVVRVCVFILTNEGISTNLAFAECVISCPDVAICSPKKTSKRALFGANVGPNSIVCPVFSRKISSKKQYLYP